MKKIYIILLIVILTVGSWLTGLNEYSYEYIKESLSEAGIAYASARGINALVSMLQSTEIGISFGVSGTLSIGEILDPLNDLIERFSDVISLVIGSLMLQRIILAIVSRTFFTIALTILGVFSTISILLNAKSLSKYSFKLFITFATLRYSIIIILILNSLFSAAFLSDQIESGNTRLYNNEQELSEMSGDEGNNPYVIKLKTQKQEIMLEKNELEKDLSKINQRIDAKGVAWYSTGDAEYQKLKQKQGIAEGKIKVLENKIDEIDDTVGDNSKKLERRFEELSNFLTPSIIAKKVSDMIDNIFELLTLFILQTILLPLLFLFSLKYLFKAVWAIDIEEIVSQKIKDIKSKGAELVATKEIENTKTAE